MAKKKVADAVQNVASKVRFSSASSFCLFSIFVLPFPVYTCFCFSVMLLWSLVKEEEGCLQFSLIEDLRSVCFPRCTKLGSE
jgi:hypothetical protein